MNVNKFKKNFFKMMKWFLIFEIFMFILEISKTSNKSVNNKASALVNGIQYMPLAVLIFGTILITLISFIDSFFKK